MRDALTLAAFELRRRLRDRSALVQGILAPIGLALIIGSAFGSGVGFSATIGVADADGSPLSQGLTDGLVGSTEAGADDPVTFVVADPATVRQQVDDGSLDAALVVPEGFGASVESASATEDLVVVSQADQAIAGGVADSVAGAVVANLDAGRLGMATATLTAVDPGDPDALAALSQQAAAIQLPVGIEVVDVSGFNVVAFFAPSMAMVFLFLVAGSGARSLVTEQADGTLDRIRAAPVSDRSILGGKTLGVAAVSLASFLTIWAVTSLAFGADWGDPAGVVLVMLGTVAAIAGISTLIAGVARTTPQADVLASVVAFSFALLGGNFVQPGAGPEVMETVSRATPNGWALAAFTDLSAGAAGASDVLGPVAVLGAIGALSLAVGAALVSRRLSG